MRMQRSVLYCRILTQERENSNFPLWQTSWPTLPRGRGLQAECTVWLPHLTLCHSICVSQSHINLHSGLLQWFIGNLSLTTNTGLKLLMTTKLALQRIHQKRQAVIFVHCFPHIDPELCKHAFIKRMLARNVLQLPVRDRGGAVTNSLTSTTALLPAQVHLKNSAKPDVLPYSVVQEGNTAWNRVWTISSWWFSGSKTRNASGIVPRWTKRTWYLIKMRIAKGLSLHFEDKVRHFETKPHEEVCPQE